MDMGDEDMGDEDMGDDFDEEGDDEEEDVSFKMIQKLTGKLAQKIRTFMEDEENEMSSKDIKYVINSIVSAIDLDSLEDDDLDEIIAKLEGEDEEEGGEEGGEEGIPSPEMPSPEMAPAPPAPPATGEVAEYEDLDTGKDFVDDIFGEGEDFEDNYGNERGYRGRKHRFAELGEDESGAVEGMIEGLFSESRVDNILKKYFKVDERERTLLEEKKKQNLITTDKINKTTVKIKNLSETVAQEISASKLLRKYPNLKLVGKSQQNNIIFESNTKRIKVTPKGSIL